MLNKIIDAFADRSRATILFLICIIIYGLFAYLKIPKESAPDVKIPIVYVVATHQGISPEDAERLILRPLENKLRAIEGMKEMTSYANEGSGSIIMEFDAGFDSAKAINDVRAKVNDAENELPWETDTPTIHEINLSLKPVLSVVLMGDIPERTLLKLARELRNRIEGIPSVLNVVIGGDREEVLEVIIQPKLLESYGLSTQSVSLVIDSNNKLVAAGAIKTKSGEYSVKVPSLVENLEDFLNFPIKADKEKVVRLKDIAVVKKTFKEPETIARVNGKPAVVLDVSKRTGKNIISTVKEIKAVVKSEKNYWPSNVKVIFSQDESDHIEDMVIDLENNIIIAVILVLIIIILSVGTRSGIIIALSIPASFLAGILVLTVMDLTLNIVVLFSLILTVGMIVDDAIVVSEFADRKMVEGVKAGKAYIISAKRMLWPIVSSTLVKILVFLPLLFWPGVIGQFMKYMPITVIAILTSSLVFALFFQPAIGPLFGGPKNISEEEARSMQAAEVGKLEDLTGFSKFYADLLQKVLKKSKHFAVGIVGALFVVYIFFFIFGPGKEFFPQVEPNLARMIIQSPGNLSISQKDKIVRKVEQKLLPFIGEVKLFYSKAGSVNKENNMPDDAIGIIQMEFAKWDTRRKAKLIIDEMLNSIGKIDGVKVQVIPERAGPPSIKPIEINFSSRQYERVPLYVDKFLTAMRKMGGFKNVEDSRSVPAIEWKIVTDRALAARHNIDVGSVGNVIKLVSNGFKVSSYRPEDANDEVDIIIRFPEEYRNISTINTLKIVTSDGKAVPLSSFIRTYPAPKVAKIKRVEREQVITVLSDVEEKVLVDDKVKQLKEWLKTNVDPEVKYTFKGDDEDQIETMNFLMNAFFLALLLMFITMLIQFNNYYHAIIIMSAVFLSTVGVLLGLLVTFQPFGIVMCGVGIIALGGVVLNNNILFIDTYQRLRMQGLGAETSIIMAGVQRARPIILTAATAILGLLPMVFSLTINIYDRQISYGAPASQWWSQLSASIAGGLAFATVLTLFFTPCLLLIGKKFDKIAENDENSR